MARIVLVTGGGRSGKSSYGQRLAEAHPEPRLLIATTVPFDEELKERVERHRRSRARRAWSTIEEPVDLAGAMAGSAGFAVVLVDCLTMWVSNLMWEATARVAGGGYTEEQVAKKCEDLLAACRALEATVILVTNEVGLGIIPDNPQARLFRDLLGRCNQIIAADADAVIFMISGLPLQLKGSANLDPIPEDQQ